MYFYALIDPYWGDPQIVKDTVSDTIERCTEKALVSEQCSLYSGMRKHGRIIKKGSLEKLINHGYSIKRIKIEILE